MPARPSSFTLPPAKRARSGARPAGRVQPKVLARQAQGYFGATSMNKEKKLIDTAAANYAADTTGTITLLNGVAQGDDYTNRQGRQFLMTSVQLRGIIAPTDTTTGSTLVRVLVVYDAATNGAAPTITDILAASTSQAFNNLNNRDRFHVVIDETHAIGGLNNTATQAYSMSPTVAQIERYERLPNVQVTNQGTGNTVASIQKGALWLVTIGDQAAASGATVSLAARVRFTDA